MVKTSFSESFFIYNRFAVSEINYNRRISGFFNNFADWKELFRRKFFEKFPVDRANKLKILPAPENQLLKLFRKIIFQRRIIRNTAKIRFNRRIALICNFKQRIPQPVRRIHQGEIRISTNSEDFALLNFGFRTKVFFCKFILFVRIKKLQSCSAFPVSARNKNNISDLSV